MNLEIGKGEMSLGSLNSRLLLATSLLLIFCQSNNSKYEKFISPKNETETEIVLVNAGDLESDGLASLLHQLTACSANVVGIHNQFLDYTSESDATLLTEIRNSGRVVLSQLQRSDGTLLRWAPVFEEAALAVGRVGFYVDEEKVLTHFYPIGQGDPEEPLSFAASLAFYYNPTDNLLRRFSLIEPTAIQFTHNLDDFEVLDGFSQIDCERVKGKIVLVGYLGPRIENTVLTPFDKISNKKTRTYSVVALANEVLTVLNAIK